MNDTTYMYAIATLADGQEEAFNFLITENQRSKLLSSMEFRNVFVEQARPYVVRMLNPLVVSGLSVMPPEGKGYEKYLEVVRGLPPEIRKHTTIDMTLDLN